LAAEDAVRRLVFLAALAAVGLGAACNGGEGGPTATPSASPSATPGATATATAAAAVQAEYPAKVSLTEPGAYLIRADGSGLLRLASGQGGFRTVWSPDGSHIAVAGVVGGAPGVSVIDVDGAAEVTVFDGSGRGPDFWVGKPLWSPDGRQLAVPAGPTDQLRADRWHTYLVNADGSGEPADLFLGSALEWSPDGAALAFVQYSDKGVALNTFDLASRTATVIERGAGSNSFAWSPDSQRMAYTTDPPFPSPQDLVIIDRDGWNRRVIAEGASDPKWSPDGKYLAFVDSSGWLTLAAVDTGADPVRLALGGIASWWSPEGDAILIRQASSLSLVSLATHRRLEAIDLAGRVPAGVGGFSVSADGERVVLTVSDPQNQIPEALFVMNIDGTGLQKLVELSTGPSVGITWGPEWSPDGLYIAFVVGRTAVS
jgi:Tol biopolymer transport system component